MDYIAPTTTRASTEPDALGRVKAYQAIDLRAVGKPIEGSRWLLVDLVNSRNQVIIVSPDADEIACFRALPGSGTDFIRARAHAVGWAQDHDIEPPEAELAGELVFAQLRMRG